MLTIGVDICNTIANLVEEVSKEFNIPLGELYTRYDLHKEHGVPVNFFDTAKGLQLFKACKPFKGSAKAFNSMEGRVRVVYITARPSQTNILTYKWLMQYRFPPGPVIFTTNKLEIVKKFTVDVMVEDSPFYINQLSEVVPVIAKSYKYNSHIDVPRFDDWSNFTTVINNITRGCSLWPGKSASGAR